LFAFPALLGLLELVLLMELLLAELFALLELLGRAVLCLAGAVDEGPAVPSLELFVVDVGVVPDVGEVADDEVFPFCAQGGRFGSSCARMGIIAAHISRNAPSSGRRCSILRWEAHARRWATDIGD